MEEFRCIDRGYMDGIRLTIQNVQNGVQSGQRAATGHYKDVLNGTSLCRSPERRDLVLGESYFFFVHSCILLKIPQDEVPARSGKVLIGSALRLKTALLLPEAADAPGWKIKNPPVAPDLRSAPPPASDSG